MVPRPRVPDALRSMARDGRCARPRRLLRSGGAASHRVATRSRQQRDLAIYPVLAIVAFFFHSWFTTGAWFVTGGFYVPDNVATGNVWKAFMAVVYGMRMLIGTPFVLLALAGVLARARARAVARRACGVARRARARRVDGAAGVRLLQRPSVPHALHGCAVGRRGGVCRHRARHAERTLAPRRGRCDRRVARRDREAASMRRRRWCRKRSGMCRSASAGGT